MRYKHRLIQFEANRVWRSYKGGRVLDELANNDQPTDSHFPEEWIASTTRAVNTGREDVVEGESKAIIDGEAVYFSTLIEQDPEYFLGREHIERFGVNPMVLVKFLDSSIRLHFQAHPTREFSMQYLNSNSGKAEAYYILKIRDEIEDPYIYLGFQQPPGKQELKQIIEQQDISTLKQCFDKIPVNQGECYFIPGGMPHAIGEGILMIEIMEPSDWAVRFEFERGGYTLPEEARFMKRDLDFCLDVFDYNKHSVEDVINNNKKQPEVTKQYADGSIKQLLIGDNTTDRFRVYKTEIKSHIEKAENEFFIGIVIQGQCKVTVGDETLVLKQFDKFFCPAGIDSIAIEASEGAEIIECYPPLSV